MTDYLTIIALTALWALTVLGAYASGRIRGHQAAQEEMRWAKWMLRKDENRRVRI